MRYAFVFASLAMGLFVACSSSDSSSSSSSSSGGTGDASSGGLPDGSSSGGPNASGEPDASEQEDGGDASTEASTTPFVLTSTAFVEGGAIPDANSCTGNINQSPPLAWTGAPAGAKSFALTFVDMSNNLIHAVAYDIPSTLTSLPAAVERAYAPASVPGMHQTTSYDNATRGYLGPCPPNQHTYVFTLYALDVAPLTDATMATTRDEAVALIGAHSLGSATLSGTYVKP